MGFLSANLMTESLYGNLDETNKIALNKGWGNLGPNKLNCNPKYQITSKSCLYLVDHYWILIVMDILYKLALLILKPLSIKKTTTPNLT